MKRMSGREFEECFLDLGGKLNKGQRQEKSWGIVKILKSKLRPWSTGRCGSGGPSTARVSPIIHGTTGLSILPKVTVDHSRA